MSTIGPIAAPPTFASSWKMDVQLPVTPPARVYARNGPNGLLALANLPEVMTVAQLKEMLSERLMIKPGRRIQLFSWGRELEDDKVLTSYCLPTNAQIDMKIVMCHLPDNRGLRRVRLVSTAIKTRQLAIEPGVTVLELKSRLHQHLLKADHEWYDLEGICSRMRGSTYVAVAEAKEDDKTGTAALFLGEEVIGMGGGGDGKKGGALTVRRAEKGTQCDVLEGNLVLLDLTPPKQKLIWRGQPMEDQQTLWDLGVRTDDEITLEFESPAMPQVLQIMRAPAPEKPPKKEKGEKGGKKKK